MRFENSKSQFDSGYPYHHDLAVAHLDRALASEATDWRFESSQRGQEAFTETNNISRRKWLLIPALLLSSWNGWLSSVTRSIFETIVCLLYTVSVMER